VLASSESLRGERARERVQRARQDPRDHLRLYRKPSGRNHPVAKDERQLIASRKQKRRRESAKWLLLFFQQQTPTTRDDVKKEA